MRYIVDSSVGHTLDAERIIDIALTSQDVFKHPLIEALQENDQNNALKRSLAYFLKHSKIGDWLDLEIFTIFIAN